MDGLTVGPKWSESDRPIRGPDFWSEILFGPTWSRYWTRPFYGPVCSPDFGTVRPPMIKFLAPVERNTPLFYLIEDNSFDFDWETASSS